MTSANFCYFLPLYVNIEVSPLPSLGSLVDRENFLADELVISE